MKQQVSVLVNAPNTNHPLNKLDNQLKSKLNKQEQILKGSSLILKKKLSFKMELIGTTVTKINLKTVLTTFLSSQDLKMVVT